MNKKLYVVTCVSNPVRYHSRYSLYKHFKKRIEDAGAILYTVEMAFGDRPFEVTSSENPRDIQLRSRHEVWHKENMLNIGIQRLPIDWEYVAWIDADIQFARPDWVEETIQQLQHYMFVQMFSHCVDLCPRFEPFQQHLGFVHQYQLGHPILKDGKYASFAHPGYAWAATREALDAVGGLMEFPILGAADHHMASAMVHKVEESYHGGVTQAYKDACHVWEERCKKYIRKNIGYVGGVINHFWHGAKADRRYQDRWNILVNHKFNPNTDIYHDSQGLLKLHADKIGLRDDVRKYFRMRFEDSDYTGKPHKMLP